jgi:hypothetical protein
LFFQKPSTWKSKISSCIELDALIITYKTARTGDGPVTEVLIKVMGIFKHTSLRGDNNRKQNLVESGCSFKSHTSVMDLTLHQTWKQSQTSEQIELN